MSASGPDLVIRPPGTDDAPALSALTEALNAHEGDPVGNFDAVRARADAIGEHRQFECLVAERAGRLVGYVTWLTAYSGERGQTGFYVNDLFVAEAERGHGTARRLMAAVARAARSEGRTFLWWCSKPHNERALAFYEKLGAITEPVIAHAIFGEPFEALAEDGGES